MTFDTDTRVPHVSNHGCKISKQGDEASMVKFKCNISVTFCNLRVYFSKLSLPASGGYQIRFHLSLNLSRCKLTYVSQWIKYRSCWATHSYSYHYITICSFWFPQNLRLNFTWNTPSKKIIHALPKIEFEHKHLSSTTIIKHLELL